MSTVIIIALVVGLIAVWRLHYGVAAIIMLWPAYLLRTTILGVPTTALELSLYAVAAVAVVKIVRSKHGWRWINVPKTWWWLFAIWTLAWTMSTVTSPDRLTAFGGYKAWLVDVHIFAALLLYVGRDHQWQLTMLKTGLLSGTVVAVVGLYQFIFQHATLQDGRLSSFFHPVANYAAMYLGPLLVVGLITLLWGVVKGWKWWAALGIMSVAMVLTVSFGGYLAVAIGTLFAVSTLPNPQLRRRLVMLGGAAAVMGIIGLGQTKYFAEHFQTSDRSSGLVRTQIWTTSWELIKQHPVVGIGPNTFENFYRQEAPKHFHPPLEWLVAQPHSLYLALWLETGLLGLISFLGFVFYYTRLVTKRLFFQVASRPFVVATVAAMMVVLIHGLFDTPYFKNDLAMLWAWIVLLPWVGKNAADS